MSQPATKERLRPFKPTRFGRYTLLLPVATGGMGEVFLAHLEGVEGFEKLCVIKKVLPHLAAEGDFARRFLDEGRTLVQLHHGAIAQVLDMGVEADAPFMALEFVDGKDLRRVLARAREQQAPLPLAFTLVVAVRMLDALAYAHRKRGDDDVELNLVHRDVSPQNVLVSYEGEVKVIDFGLAKSTLSEARTSPGTMLGKFRYMSPEQARRQPVDRRSDLYSMGLVLYELLSGDSPFEGVSPGELMAKVVSPAFRPLVDAAPACPRALSQVVMKALAVDPAQRFQSAEELRGRLQSVLLEVDPAAGPETVSQQMRALFAAEYQAERKQLAVLREQARALSPDPEPSGDEDTVLPLAPEHPTDPGATLDEGQLPRRGPPLASRPTAPGPAATMDAEPALRTSARALPPVTDETPAAGTAVERPTRSGRFPPLAARPVEAKADEPAPRPSARTAPRTTDEVPAEPGAGERPTRSGRFASLPARPAAAPGDTIDEEHLPATERRPTGPRTTDEVPTDERRARPSARALPRTSDEVATEVAMPVVAPPDEPPARPREERPARASRLSLSKVAPAGRTSGLRQAVPPTRTDDQTPTPASAVESSSPPAEVPAAPKTMTLPARSSPAKSNSALVWVVVPLVALLAVGGYIAWDVFAEKLRAAQVAAQADRETAPPVREERKSREVKAAGAVAPEAPRSPEDEELAPTAVVKKPKAPGTVKAPAAATAQLSPGARAYKALKAEFDAVASETLAKKYRLRVHALGDKVDARGDDPGFLSDVEALRSQLAGDAAKPEFQ